MDDVDLEKLAAAYRHRPLSKAGARRALRAFDESGAGPGDWLLDAGGGTGAHAAEWAGRGGNPVVLDRSSSMVEAAHALGLPAVRGAVERLPFPARTFRLVYAHLVVHYGPLRPVLTEARRVLAPAGLLWIWTFDPDDVAGAFLSRWFPRIAGIDRRRFPAIDRLEARMEDLGLVQLERGRDVEVKTWTAGEWQEAVRAGFVSTLQLLSPQELEAGLAAFRRAHADPSSVLTYRLPFCWVAGRAPA